MMGDGFAHDVICVITPCSIKLFLTFRRNDVEMDTKLSVILKMKAARSSETSENTWYNNLD